MSDHEQGELFTSTTAPTQTTQTADNTVAPFEAKPQAPTKPKRIRLTPAQREKKIAEGWNPPGPRPGHKTKPAAPEAIAIFEDHTDGAVHEAETLLVSLVEKLVSLENDSQYRSVWSHFFVHGGVYNGPNYMAELQAACDYLNAKNRMG